MLLGVAVVFFVRGSAPKKRSGQGAAQGNAQANAQAAPATHAMWTGFKAGEAVQQRESESTTAVSYMFSKLVAEQC